MNKIRSIKYLSEENLASQFNMSDLKNHMTQSLLNNSRLNDCIIPPRILIKEYKPFSVFGSMPALNRKRNIFINKVATLVEGEGKASVESLLSVYSSKTGELIATIDGTYITKIKCAAISALITEHCMPLNCCTLGVIGTGVQAFWQVIGLCSLKGIQKVYIFSRSKDKYKSFEKALNKALPNNIEIIMAKNLNDISSNCEVISTATTSNLPFFDISSSFKEGVHINCIGAHTINTREISHSLINSSISFVEDRDTAILEAGKVHQKSYEVEDIFNLNINKLKNSRTVFSSTGHAFYDLITTDYILTKLIN